MNIMIYTSFIVDTELIYAKKKKKKKNRYSLFIYNKRWDFVHGTQTETRSVVFGNFR